MYLDQRNETVLCAANCVFTGAAENCVYTPSTPDCGAAVVIGPDATTTATGLTRIVAQFNQGVFAAGAVTDVQFDQPYGGGKECTCAVALGGAMYDVGTADGTGIPTTNDTTRLSGQTTYVPPTFANAASVGVPLTLAPSEFGMGVTTGTLAQPGAAGLKLSVQCHGPHSGTVDIVALAGTSNTPVVLNSSPIGANVQACN
jgi:hypothetical protein